MTASAFYVERVSPEYVVPVLIDDHGATMFRCSPCVCVDQAAYAATRGGTRPLAFAGVWERRRGEWRIAAHGACDSVDPMHTHVHGHLLTCRTSSIDFTPR